MPRREIGAMHRLCRAACLLLAVPALAGADEPAVKALRSQPWLRFCCP